MWQSTEPDATHLCCRDFDGAGQPVLLLHGACGHAHEWAQTASWMMRTCHVLAPDQRAHGSSERRPLDVSRAAFVDDAAMWIERLCTRPAVVVSLSLGGHTAFLLAARPRFDLDVVLAAVRGAATRDHWDEWSSVRCPTLIVTVQAGFAARDRDRMRETVRAAEASVIPDAGHDLHLEQPDAWQRAVEPFLLRHMA
jgi:pimeloyl-ACP methyl ester carboxylesterase